MNKSIFMFIVIIILAGRAAYSLATTTIFNEERGDIYIGGGDIARILLYKDNIRKTTFRNKVYRISLEDEKARLIVETKDRILSLKARKSLLVVAEINVDGESGKDHRSLLLYDKKGMLLKTIDGVVLSTSSDTYSLSPDGTEIAYLTGNKLYETRKPFDPTGVWIYNVKNNETKKIAGGGYEIKWSDHDNKIYIRDNYRDPTRMSIYDTNKGVLSKSTHKGLLFSGDGKHYVGVQAENIMDVDADTPVFYIFDSTTNKKIHQFKIGEYSARIDWYGYGAFIKRSNHILIWGSYAKGKYKLFDVDTKQTIRESKSHLLGWNEDMTKLIVYEGGGKQIHIEETLTGKRLKSLDIPK